MSYSPQHCKDYIRILVSLFWSSLPNYFRRRKSVKEKIISATKINASEKNVLLKAAKYAKFLDFSFWLFRGGGPYRVAAVGACGPLVCSACWWAGVRGLGSGGLAGVCWGGGCGGGGVCGGVISNLLRYPKSYAVWQLVSCTYHVYY